VKNTNEDDKKVKNNIEDRELLLVKEDEINFMQSIGFIIGDSPRTIKRYINIYRIIRTHAKFEFLDANELEHHYAAMILLGVISRSLKSH
jgi:hypothetical protein